MSAEHLAQRGVQQVCRGVIEHGRAATLAIDLRRHDIAHFDLALHKLADVCVGIAELLRVEHFESHTWRGELTLVADLSAGFRVERVCDRESPGLPRPRAADRPCRLL